ncbi:ParB-like nuclease domain-containing protein [Salmonella enterica subsp. enterica serovar Saintpaul]|nr:ParB-like nuclease domain-containing protein [Salmonella enterica subsp. enterica serovar Saintpaul]
MTLDELIIEIASFLENTTSEADKIEALNTLRQVLHQHSPFVNEPVDCVLWLKASELIPNDYNPNVMAPPEKKLLQRSLETNGYTQPIVATVRKKGYTIIDGYHRYSLGKSKAALRKKLNQYLPVTLISEDGLPPAERIAATIRHNRARGKHQIAAMSAIVQDLHRLGWEDSKISGELGMDADEVLRLKQVSGLAELFLDNEYSTGWTVK